MERKEINWKMALMLGSLFSSSTRNLLLVFISNSEVFKKKFPKSRNTDWWKEPEGEGSFVVPLSGVPFPDPFIRLLSDSRVSDL